MSEMQWCKSGLTYAPQAVHIKLLTHAANPLAVFLKDDIYRVFYSGRDEKNRSSVGYVDVDIVKNSVIYVHDKPVFKHGLANTFYSHGVSIGNCYLADGKRYILFMGWQMPENGHWRGDIGRLILHDDLTTMTLDSEAPYISVNEIDLISLSYPWVLAEGSEYKMWYGSTITWDAGNGEMLHVLNYGSSNGGHNWQLHGLSVPYELGKAQAFSRPSVLKDQDGYSMWFSYRSGMGEKYRIGFATSINGQNWELILDEVGIDVSESGWDSEMIEYPFVFDHKGQRYMFYNGNGNGKTGFGLAKLNA